MSAASLENPRRVLVVCRSAPYGAARARDAVDLVMAFAAFDQRATLLFLGDGVLSLLRGHQPDTSQARNLENLLGTLADYGVEAIRADAAALAARGLAAEELASGATPASESEVRDLFATHELVLTV